MPGHITEAVAPRANARLTLNRSRNAQRTCTCRVQEAIWAVQESRQALVVGQTGALAAQQRESEMSEDDIKALLDRCLHGFTGFDENEAGSRLLKLVLARLAGLRVRVWIVHEHKRLAAPRSGISFCCRRSQRRLAGRCSSFQPRPLHEDGQQQAASARTVATTLVGRSVAVRCNAARAW